MPSTWVVNELMSRNVLIDRLFVVVVCFVKVVCCFNFTFVVLFAIAVD
jgi:hypothetical protein